MTEPELLPCPFCGERLMESGTRRHLMFHPGSNCILENISVWNDEPETVEAWNRRTPPSSPINPEEEKPANG